MKILMTVIAAAALLSTAAMADDQTQAAAAGSNQAEAAWHPGHRGGDWHRGGWHRGPGCSIGFFHIGCHADVAADEVSPDQAAE